jgi:hypothetical protein
MSTANLDYTKSQINDALAKALAQLIITNAGNGIQVEDGTISIKIGNPMENHGLAFYSGELRIILNPLGVMIFDAEGRLGVNYDNATLIRDTGNQALKVALDNDTIVYGDGVIETAGISDVLSIDGHTLTFNKGLLVDYSPPG